MSIAERIPAMDDEGLGNLRGNAERLAQSGTPKQRADAATLLPLILSELETRRAARPAKAPVRRKAAPKRVARRPSEDSAEESEE